MCAVPKYTNPLLYLYFAPSGDEKTMVGFAITADGVLLARAQNAADLQNAWHMDLYTRFFDGAWELEVVTDGDHPGLAAAIEKMKNRKKAIDTIASYV